MQHKDLLVHKWDIAFRTYKDFELSNIYLDIWNLIVVFHFIQVLKLRVSWVQLGYLLRENNMIVGKKLLKKAGKTLAIIII